MNYTNITFAPLLKIDDTDTLRPIAAIEIIKAYLLITLLFSQSLYLMDNNSDSTPRSFKYLDIYGTDLAGPP